MSDPHSPSHVYRAPDDAPMVAAPLDRQRAAALALHVDDPELARVRRLLADLRPDYPDALVPLAEALPAAPPMGRMSDPSADWGGVPRSLLAPPPTYASTAGGAEVLRRLAGLPADAAGLLRWLRLHATLAAGLRGLYVDVGGAFASEAQSTAWADLGARREGAVVHGRRLVLRAAEAWEDSQRGHR